jgi:hypothetical protein
VTHRSRRPSPVTRTTALVVAVVLGLAACGGDDAAALDREATEDAIAEVVADGLGVQVDAVVCPDDVERTAGATAACRGVLADDVGDVRIEVRRADEEGTLGVEVLDAVIDRVDVARQLDEELAATYERDFTVDCGGDGPDVVAPDTSFACVATDADGAREVTVTVTDQAGTLRFEVADGPDPDEGG